MCLQQEKQIYASQAEGSGKPPQVIDKIVEGKLDKFYKEACLMEQSWVHDPNLTITDLIGEYTGQVGRENRDSPLRAFPARRRYRQIGRRR